jgi:excisionase family DNA binding protein
MKFTPATSKQLYTADEAAERLNLHVKTVRKFIRDGKLPAKRIGKEYRITRAALDDFAGVPASSSERPAPRTRQVIVSSIVDVDVIGPDDSQRITTLVLAGLNAPHGTDDHPRVDTLYDTGRGRLRIMITAQPALTCDLIRTIAALAEGSRE